MGGHTTIGRVTIHGENAMHWAVSIRTKRWGSICFTLPFRCFGKYWGCHIYFSPNGTPWAATYYKSLWKEKKPEEEIRARIRKLNFGHGFSTSKHKIALRIVNDKFESMRIGDYELEKYECENSREN